MLRLLTTLRNHSIWGTFVSSLDVLGLDAGRGTRSRDRQYGCVFRFRVAASAVCRLVGTLVSAAGRGWSLIAGWPSSHALDT